MIDRASPPPLTLDGPLLASLLGCLQDHAILMLDSNGLITDWNVTNSDFKGWRLEDLLGVDHAVFYPLDTPVGRPDRDLLDAMTYGRLDDQGWRARRDGSAFWAETVTTPVRDAVGNLVAFAEVIRDVTDHHAAIGALRRSEARLRALTESAGDAIWTVDSTGRITSWNPAAAQLYGHSAAQAIGRPLGDLVPARRRDKAQTALARLRSVSRWATTHPPSTRASLSGPTEPRSRSSSRWAGGSPTASACARRSSAT